MHRQQDPSSPACYILMLIFFYTFTRNYRAGLVQINKHRTVLAFAKQVHTMLISTPEYQSLKLYSGGGLVAMNFMLISDNCLPDVEKGVEI